MTYRLSHLQSRVSVLVVLAVLATVAAAWAGKKESSKTDQPTTAVRLGDEARREAVIDEIVGRRKQLIRELIDIVDPANVSNYSYETRAAAAYLLGELRAEEAIEVLSEVITMSPEFGNRIILEPSKYNRPAWAALVKIGRPCIPAMIDKIKHSDSSIERQMSMDVLNQLLGGKRRLSELLTRLEREETDPGVRNQIAESRRWAEDHYTEDQEPLF